MKRPIGKSAADGAIVELLRRRANRRDVLVGGGLLAVGGLVACRGNVAQRPGFSPIQGSTADTVRVPGGFSVDVLLRWGDPIGSRDGLPMERLAAGALFEDGAADAQGASFGASCDGLGVFAIGSDRLVICVNHETPEVARMFPGLQNARRERRVDEFFREHPEAIAVMRASVGVSVLEFERSDGTWRLVRDSQLNRRLTADTPIVFSGPAATHAWLGSDGVEPGTCLGTLGNCAAGATPWGTYLTAEENTNDFFGNAGQAEMDPMLERANDRFGMRSGSSVYRWELVEDRFDHAKYPTESMRFGWIVEIDPRDPEAPARKLTALGRMRHEGATTVLAASGRPVVYMGDDASFEYFYKFVSDRVVDENSEEGNDRLLDEGTLYVARLNDDGSGEWLPLRYGEHEALTEQNGFASQADVVIRCREAADLLGATPLDRPEDVAVHPGNRRVYLACTQGVRRGAERSDTPPDAANPRGPNPYGHILEFTEEGGDATAQRFAWEVFILAGDPDAGLAELPAAGRLGPADAYYAGLADADGLSAFACPDNLAFDSAGNLWIVTDGTQPNDYNNGCFVCPTEGGERGAVRQFMSGPIGAEICGCTFSPDGETLFLTVQHPGGGSPLEEPSSHWPDGGDAQPRSSLIAVRAVDPDRGFFV